MTVLILGLLIFMSALGRAMTGTIVALARTRPPAHDIPSYEQAFRILIQPAALLIRKFDHMSTESIFALLALNSLLWGIGISAVIGLFRRRRPQMFREDKAEMPILE